MYVYSQGITVVLQLHHKFTIPGSLATLEIMRNKQKK